MGMTRAIAGIVRSRRRKFENSVPPNRKRAMLYAVGTLKQQGCQHAQGRNAQAVFEIEPAIAAGE